MQVLLLPLLLQMLPLLQVYRLVLKVRDQYLPFLNVRIHFHSVEQPQGPYQRKHWPNLPRSNLSNFTIDLSPLLPLRTPKLPPFRQQVLLDHYHPARILRVDLKIHNQPMVVAVHRLFTTRQDSPINQAKQVNLLLSLPLT
jgi:hypothetical protein